MKRSLILLGWTLAMLCGAAGLTGCSSDDDEPAPAPTELGTYRFDGVSYDILSVRSSNDGSYLMFSFSPLAASAPMTTYVAFGIRLYWLGSEVDISTVSHNDDYIFIYEDPVHYYSQYRRPLEGSYFVGENGENNYTVRIRFTLPDGKPFEMDFTGDFPVAE